jgi:L-ascorbate metabolism protein UlaG (beta-lactamase superfamily)
MKRLKLFVWAALVLMLNCSFLQSQVILDSSDAACQTPRLVSTGGPFPEDRNTLAVRWTGYSNFELVYNNQIILLDTYFNRGSGYPQLGFKAEDISRANVILLGHGHSDHMADAATVGIKTKATIVGAALTIETLRTQPIDARQLVTVNGRGGESLKFGGFTVEPILARHGEPPAEVTAVFRRALQAAQPASQATAPGAGARPLGTDDPKVLTEGTIAYLITLDNGFRIMFRDSGGRVTEQERAALARVGAVDLALAATSAAYLTNLVVDQALEYVQVYRPRVFMPAHHDAPSTNLWRPTEPIFQAIKDKDPSIITISRGYREPTCFDTTKKREVSR